MPGPQKNDRDLITTAGDMVVYCAGFPAIYGRQPLYFEDPTVVADGFYDRKIEFIAAGNVYYTRRKELTWLLKAAEKAGICIEHFAINKSTNRRIIRIFSSCSADKSSIR